MSELRAVLAESFHTHNEETLITEIYKLQAENKALKEKDLEIIDSYKIKSKKVNLLIEKVDELEAENKTLKESRYELLEAYKEHRWDMCRLGVREELIEEAESQKKKESK